MRAVPLPRESRVRTANAQTLPPAHSATVVYPIGALARTAQVSTRTIRYYEEIRLLETARRFSGGRRVFGAEALERLRFIARLKRLGFSLDEIRHLNEVFALKRSTAQMLAVLDKQLERHLAQIEQRLREGLDLKSELMSYRKHIRNRVHTLKKKGAARRDRNANSTAPQEPQ
jgi:DNA-binding transcriptional MerR regulator